MIKNAGFNKKLIHRCKGPYKIKQILPNDKYVVGDSEGFQLMQLPFESIFEPSKLKLYTRSTSTEDDDMLCYTYICW